jgi:Skp family chaperone for outer membrane proteins
MAPGITKYASDHGFGMILDTSTQWPQSNLLWYAPSVDITKTIVEGYDGSAQASAQLAGNGTKFAILNIQQAVFASSEGRQQVAALQKDLSPEQAELKARSDNLQAMKTAAQTSSQEMAAKQRDFDAAVKAAQEDAQAKQKAIFQEILNKMAPVITKYATDHGYGMVLDSTNPWPQSSLLWYAPSADITKAIVEVYDSSSPCNALDDVVQIDDASGLVSAGEPGHCGGEADFWFTNISTQPIDCAIMFHKHGRFDPASVMIFTLGPGEKSGGTGKISTCGSDTGQMQYHCFPHAESAAASCATKIHWQ